MKGEKAIANVAVAEKPYNYLESTSSVLIIKKKKCRMPQSLLFISVVVKSTSC